MCVVGSFDCLLMNFMEFKEFGFCIKINLILICWNESEIEGMYEIVDGFGYWLQIDFEVMLCDDGDLGLFEFFVMCDGLWCFFEIQ